MKQLMTVLFLMIMGLGFAQNDMNRIEGFRDFVW